MAANVASTIHLLDEHRDRTDQREKTEVVLTVSAAVAVYFRRRKLISRQVVEKELEDGGLIVSGKFAHPNQIFPIVRYWLPHVRIVSPESWQEELEKEPRTYLEHRGEIMVVIGAILAVLVALLIGAYLVARIVQILSLFAFALMVLAVLGIGFICRDIRLRFCRPVSTLEAGQHWLGHCHSRGDRPAGGIPDIAGGHPGNRHHAE